MQGKEVLIRHVGGREGGDERITPPPSQLLNPSALDCQPGPSSAAVAPVRHMLITFPHTWSPIVTQAFRFICSCLNPQHGDT